MSFDRDDINRISIANILEDDHQRLERAPTERQKIRSFTVICLILNRTIGSSIFETPGEVLLGTNSVGISILFWAVGGLVATCGVLVWLEFGLSIPRQVVSNGEERSVPRSGGEKNYLEFVYPSPRFLATCIYGIMFILLGNLSGNAIAFGQNVLVAANLDSENTGHVIGLATAALTASCMLHVCTRRGGILVNNCFAVLKVSILLTIIIIGFCIAGGANFGGGSSQTANFNVHTSFHNPSGNVASYTDSFYFIFYAFGGFQQPFYVLSEVYRPRKNFATATLTAMLIATVLFVLVNVAYFCVVPKENSGIDMGVIFFSTAFGNEIAPRLMAGLIALSIFGNLVVMTFTASRVKQEIAKEGILPFSLFFATGTTTPDAWLTARWQSRKTRNNRKSMSTYSTASINERETQDEQLETTPMAALLLHWTSSMLLIAVTSMLKPYQAYNALVDLYSYAILVVIGCLVSGGLLYLKWSPHRNWADQVNFKPWGGPTAAIIYCTVCIFLLITAFLKPSDSSPYTYDATGILWFIIPTIGLVAPMLGVFWFAGLHFVMWIRGHQLIVTRKPLVVQQEEDGEWVLQAELVDHEWHAKAPLPMTYADEEYSAEMVPVDYRAR